MQALRVSPKKFCRVQGIIVYNVCVFCDFSIDSSQFDYALSEKKLKNLQNAWVNLYKGYKGDGQKMNFSKFSNFQLNIFFDITKNIILVPECRP